MSTIPVKEKTLRFAPTAFAKVKWFMKKAKNYELSGFGITEENDPLYVTDFQTIKQVNGGATTDLDDVSLAKYVAENAKKGISPSRCMRVWIHTHPFCVGTPSPSGQDDSTLRNKLMDDCDWAIMVILGKGTGYFAELHTKIKIPGEPTTIIPLEISVDWMPQIWEAHKERWEREYKTNITTVEAVPVLPSYNSFDFQNPFDSTEESTSKKGMLFKKWHASDTNLSFSEYQAAIKEDFTHKEIIKWGKAVADYCPAILREAERRVLASDRKKKKTKKSKANPITPASTGSLASMGIKKSNVEG